MTADRRRNRRYGLQQALRYRTAKRREDTGVLADISTGGISACLPQTLRRGSRVELALEWPAAPGQAEKVELVVVGRVLRTGRERTAVAIEKCEFVKQRDHSL